MQESLDHPLDQVQRRLLAVKIICIWIEIPLQTSNPLFPETKRDDQFGGSEQFQNCLTGSESLFFKDLRNLKNIISFADQD